MPISRVGFQNKTPLVFIFIFYLFFFLAIEINRNNMSKVTVYTFQENYQLVYSIIFSHTLNYQIFLKL